MLSTSSLASKLATDFPDYTFTPAKEFLWSPEKQTVFYIAGSTDASSFLHELAHAVLHHQSYTRDIELLEMERAAWLQAEVLAKGYGVTVTPDTVEDSLDTYRDWLHARSTCPGCEATGVQTKKNEYKCIACRTKWRVNDARICALRRYTLPK